MSTKQLQGRRKFVRDLAVGLTAVPVSGMAQAISTNSTSPPMSRQSDRRYILDIRDFGAIPDNKTLATKSIQSAVDRCHEAGGGKVVIPPGRYLSAPLFLRSNLELELLPGPRLHVARARLLSSGCSGSGPVTGDRRSVERVKCDEPCYQAATGSAVKAPAAVRRMRHSMMS